MEERFKRIAVTRFEWGREANQRQIRRGDLRDDLAVHCRDGRIDILQIKLRATGNRQSCAVRRFAILEQNDRCALRMLSRCYEKLVAHDPLGRFRIDKGIFEKPKPELVTQESPHGNVDPLLRNLARFDQFDDHSRARFTAELVDARIQRLLYTLWDREVFDSPGTRGQHVGHHAECVRYHRLPRHARAAPCRRSRRR